MSDHEFEKRVKQKMDELRFSPSDAVWNGVQREIGKGRSNRRGWLWIPAMLVAISVTGYFFMNNNASEKTLLTNQTESSQSKNKSNSSADQQPTRNDAQSSQSATSGIAQRDQVANSATGASAEQAGTAHSKADQHKTNNTVPVNDEHGADELADLAIIQKPANSLKNPSVNTGRKQSSTNNLNDNHRLGNVIAGTNAKLAPPRNKSVVGKPGKMLPESNGSESKIPGTVESENSITGRDVSGSNDRKTAIDAKTSSGDSGNIASKNTKQIEAGEQAAEKSTTDLATADPATADLVAADNKIDQATDDSLQKFSDSVIAAKSATPVVSEIATIKTKATKSSSAKSWTWGVSASGGVSKLSDGKITDAFKSSETFDAALATQAPNNSGFVFMPNTVGIPPPKPSKAKPGVYFSVGGFVKKQISKRFAVSAGLQYSQHNHLIHTGNRVDSSQLVNNGAQVMNVARYYRADQTSRFSNKYHFIELPVTLHTQLNKSERFPLIWNLGAGVGRIIGSNALVFDSGTGVYFKDKSKYNKTQFTMSTGFSVGMFSKSANPVWIGPSVRYNNSRLFISEMKDEKHLFSASLDVRVFLNKK